MKIGISASAVLSETDRLEELFRPDIAHIEVGLFESQDIADRFARRVRQRGKRFGIHSPLIRGGSKYDLLEAVEISSEAAWEQVEAEAHWCRLMQADYLLVHFPYATTSGTLNVSTVSDGIQRLSSIQRQSGTQIICEPKLGDGREAAGIGWLRKAPRGIFSSAGLRLCWDVGDHLLAGRSEADYFRQLDRWRSSIAVVHLHNVRFEETMYRWTPPHPSRSQVNSEFDMRRIIKSLPQEATVVAEYTPQRVATEAAIETSFSYLKALTQEERNARI